MKSVSYATNIRLFAGIGRVELIIEDTTPGVPQPLSRFNIPNELTGEVAVECLRACYHNVGLTDDQKQLVIQFADMLRPKLYAVHLYDEDTNEDGTFQAVFGSLEKACEYIVGANDGDERLEAMGDSVLEVISENMGFELSPTEGYRITEETLGEYKRKSET